MLAPVSSLSLCVGAGPGSLSVILNVRYFDKNSAKCGIKYIKSILNTAILYYISPLSHTRMFTEFFVHPYFVSTHGKYNFTDVTAELESKTIFIEMFCA